MIKLLTNPWINLPIGALVYLGATLLFWKTPTPPPPPAEETKSAFTGPSWEFTNPEADQLMGELSAEKGALIMRKQQLDDLDSRLQASSNELVAATQTLRHMQDEFDKAVVRVKDEELPNLKKLAKVYADMTPDAAATVMGHLDDVNIVKIMLFMKESEAASILETLAKKGPAEEKRAAAISEHVRLSIAHQAAAK